MTTDATGGRRLRYDGVRGVRDTVVTPVGDSLTYPIDAWGPAVGA
ncbi:MAG: hypothetical protein AABY85_09655 [Gemmatimonadota bacterium]